MTRTSRARLWQRWLVPALVSAGLVAGVKALEYRAGIQGWALAWLTGRVRSAAPRPDPRVVVVGIDEATLKDPRLPHWGPDILDRRAHAEVLRRLHAAGAAVIGLDLIFDRPADDPFADAELAAAMGEAAPVVLTVAAAPDPDHAGRPAGLVEPPPDYLAVERLRLASPLVQRWATTQTTFGIEIDHVESEHGGPGQLIRPFGFELYQAYREAGGDPEPAPVRVLGRELMAIRWPAAPVPEAFTVVPYGKLWDGSWLREHPDGLKGKAVLIGQVSPTGAGDAHRTPGGTVSGIFVHAAALQTLLDRSSPADCPWWVSLLLAAAAFALVTLCAYRFAPGRVALGTGVLILAVWAVSYAALARVPSVWLNPMTATLAAATALVTRLFWHNVTALGALGRFVDPDLAQELAATGRVAPWREGQWEATILFADLRSYTELSERLAPDEMMRLLNDHFTWTDGVIRAHGGRVDKHVGDALMAVFTAANNRHALQAVAAAAALVRGAAEREAVTPGLRFGIGIHSGTLEMGELGGKRTGGKVEYGAIGDTVNVAARLEGATKEMGVQVLISAATASRLPAGTALLPLGEVSLKGKSSPVAVYTLPAE
jgi:adenylate cyclase